LAGAALACRFRQPWFDVMEKAQPSNDQESAMSSRPLMLAVAATFGFAAVPLVAQQKVDLSPYLMTDRAAEIALARSAAPKHVSDSAAVLVLARSGFVEAVRGSNGFTCFVDRSFDSPLSFPGFWDPSIRAPQCLNEAATRTVLPATRQRTEWVMSGLTLPEIVERTRRANASHEYSTPAAGAMAFMLSHEQHLANPDHHWVPHLMFYYDKSTPAAAWGVGGATNTLIGAPGDADSPILLVLIPVPRWSDGSLVATGDKKEKP
jgi:hypothetical protein